MATVAVWPAPIDADACFLAAGFSEFADTTDEWDSQWRAIIHRAIEFLTQFGTPAIRTQITPFTPNRLLDRILKGAPKSKPIRLALTDQVVLPTIDDQFPTAIVDFGEERLATVITGNGHPVLWICTDLRVQWTVGQMFPLIKNGMGVSQRTLDWSKIPLPEMSG